MSGPDSLDKKWEQPQSELRIQIHKIATEIEEAAAYPFASRTMVLQRQLVLILLLPTVAVIGWSSGSGRSGRSASSLSASSSNGDIVTTSDALALLSEAKALRQQASMIQEQLKQEKEERIRKQQEKVDRLIDSLLFHSMNNDSEESKQQLLHTEEQVADLLISKRMSYEMVNQMFDRIVELANRPQSIDSCSPLLSLLLDAACQVDCLERDDNPNKRWNHRVERDLRRKVSGVNKSDMLRLFNVWY